MTLFSIENLAQSDSKSSPSRWSPDVASQADAELYPRLEAQHHHQYQSPSRPSSTESLGSPIAGSGGSGPNSDGSSTGVSPVSATTEDQGPPSTKKPPHSYIALIAMAIIHSPEKRLLLCDIYEFIMKRYPFFKDNERSWRNSIRHNLSLNECFIKVGRSGDGRGHYWAIHPANLEDFARGDYRRRQARRRVRAAVYSPYAYPTAIPSAAHQQPGFLPIPYAAHLSDVIPKAHYAAASAMLPGIHPYGLGPSPYHVPFMPPTMPTSIPVSHPYLHPTAASFRPDFTGRLAPVSSMYPTSMTSLVSTSVPVLSIEEQSSRLLPSSSPPSAAYSSIRSSRASLSPPSVLPTSSAWSPPGVC